MPTSVHIPGPLLNEIDRRAKRLRISRNKLIVNALHKELAQERNWSSDFFDRLSQIERDDAAEVDRIVLAIGQGRTQKGPPRL